MREFKKYLFKTAREHQGAPLRTYNISFVGETCGLPIFQNLGFFHHFGTKNALLKIFSTTLLTSFSKYDIVLL